MQRRRCFVLVHKRLGGRFCGLKDFIEAPFGLDGRNDVQTFLARGFHERMVAERLKVVFEIECNSDNFGERKTLGGIKVNHKIIRSFKIRRSRMHLVEFDTGEVGEEDERRFLCRNHVIDFLVFLLVAELDVVHPVWSPARPVFLKKHLAPDPIRKTNNRKGSTFDMGENCRGEFQVVLDEFGFEEIVVGPEYFLQVRKLNRSLADLDVLRCARHGLQI